jgi:ketosteroid isomerase-like protein
MQKQIIILLTLVLFGFTLTAVAQTNDQVAREVIAITKAQWAAQSAKKPAPVWMKTVADEYTEFNPDSPIRLDGKALNGRLGDAFTSGSGEFVVDEMVNEKVQVYGDVAILSYNYVGVTKDKDGKVETSLAKSTRVYVKKDGKWMLVHANFAPVK